MQKLNQFLQCKVTNNLIWNSVGYGLLFKNYEQRKKMASPFDGLTPVSRFAVSEFLRFAVSMFLWLAPFLVFSLLVLSKVDVRCFYGSRHSSNVTMNCFLSHVEGQGLRLHRFCGLLVLSSPKYARFSLRRF